MSDTKLRHLFEDHRPGQEVHWFDGESRNSLACEYEGNRITFTVLRRDRFRVDWAGGGCEAWVDHARRAIASDGGFDITTEPDLVYLGKGPRILWNGFGDNIYLKWEAGTKILHSGHVWRDADRKAGVKSLLVLDGQVPKDLAPLLLALPLLIEQMPPPPASGP